MLGGTSTEGSMSAEGSSLAPLSILSSTPIEPPPFHLRGLQGQLVICCLSCLLLIPTYIHYSNDFINLPNLAINAIFDSHGFSLFCMFIISKFSFSFLSGATSADCDQMHTLFVSTPTSPFPSQSNFIR